MSVYIITHAGMKNNNSFSEKNSLDTGKPTVCKKLAFCDAFWYNIDT